MKTKTLLVILVDKESPLEVKKYLDGAKMASDQDLLFVISNSNKFLLEFSFKKGFNERVFYLQSEKKHKSKLFEDAFKYMCNTLNVEEYNYVVFPKDIFNTSYNSIRKAIYAIDRKKTEALVLKKKFNYFFSKPLLYVYEQRYLKVTKINPFKRFNPI